MNPIPTEAEPETELGTEIPLPPRGEDLPCDDGEPLETARHRIAMNLLIDSLAHYWRDREDVYVGGNMFIYYSSQQAKNRDFRGPDFYAVLDVDGTISRKSWVVWEEDGRYPDVIIELMSDSTARVDKNEKKLIYQRIFRTADYFVFHPYDENSLQGWHLVGNEYIPIEKQPNGWMWSESLGLWLGTWWGKILQEETHWLRFFTPQEELVLLDNEQARQEAQQARQEAEQAQQRSRQLEEQVKRYQEQFGDLE
jgi:Uma2 family endonuclease